jgi:hypothetical protein
MPLGGKSIWKMGKKKKSASLSPSEPLVKQSEKIFKSLFKLSKLDKPMRKIPKYVIV